MTKRKAKRHLVDFDFEGEGSAVHLVSKKQGGAANGHTVLIKKSNATDHLPDVEDVNIQKKLEQIQVTMSMEEFLRKFFDMWYDEAELLTAMLGFQTEYEAMMESESEPMDHASYIAEKLSGFEIMKSMYENSENKESVSALDFVTILETQMKIEKQLNEEMMDKVSIEKSRLTALEAAEQELTDKVEIVKSLEGKVAELTEQLDTIKKAQADAELESFKAKIKDLVEEEKVERIAKSLMSMDEEAAADFIDALTVKKEAVEKTGLFEEVGNEGEADLSDDDGKKKFEAFLEKSLAGKNA